MSIPFGRLFFEGVFGAQRMATVVEHQYCYDLCRELKNFPYRIISQVDYFCVYKDLDSPARRLTVAIKFMNGHRCTVEISDDLRVSDEDKARMLMVYNLPACKGSEMEEVWGDGA